MANRFSHFLQLNSPTLSTGGCPFARILLLLLHFVLCEFVCSYLCPIWNYQGNKLWTYRVEGHYNTVKCANSESHTTNWWGEDEENQSSGLVDIRTLVRGWLSSSSLWTLVVCGKFRTSRSCKNTYFNPSSWKSGSLLFIPIIDCWSLWVLDIITKVILWT